MISLQATFKNGEVVLDVPADWPEGCRLRVEPVASEPEMGRPAADAPETPEEIAAWLHWYRGLEPLEFTPQEEADLAAWRQQVKAYELARSPQRQEGLFP